MKSFGAACLSSFFICCVGVTQFSTALATNGRRPSFLPQRLPPLEKKTAPEKLSTGEPNFAPVVSYNSGDQFGYWVAAADVNSDGNPDLLVVNQCVSGTSCEANGSIGVLLGQGDGTFRPAVTYGSGGHTAMTVAVADVNGDGKPDLLVANQCGSNDVNCLSGTQGNIGVLINNGDGTFQTAITYGSGGYDASFVSVADVNGDGVPDLIVSNNCGTEFNCANGGLGTVGVLLGNGDGTFQTAMTYLTGSYRPYGVVISDINGDGKPDMLVANGCPNANCTNLEGSVGVLLGNGDGTFQKAVTYGSGGVSSVAVAVSDVNGDGRPDLVVANNCGNNGCGSGGLLGVLLGNGDGTFQKAVTYGSGGGGGVQAVIIEDVNGDGKLDLVAANFSGFNGGNYEGGLGVLLGNGDGTFQNAVTFDSGGYAALSVASADVNNDGKPDLLAANLCESGGACNNGVAGVLINISLTPTITTLTSSVNPSNFGQAVTLTATVSPNVWKGVPSGTVSFLDGGTNIGNSNLNNSGVATLTTSSLAVGTHSITATYNGDANFLPSTSPVLNQVVQGAIVVISPTSLDFGNQTVGIPSKTKYVTLQSTGNIDLMLSTISIMGSDFLIIANSCPPSLPPGKSCSIGLSFLPGAPGVRNGVLTINDNAPNSPQSVPLTGIGVLPTATFSPTSFTFGTQVVFTTSPAQKLTLTNTGLGILKITTGKFSGPFTGTTNCGKTLNPGASCTTNVVFKPKTKGQLSGSIGVTDNAPDSPQTVPLSGTGTYVDLTPTKLNFGTQPVGTTSVPKYITFVNKGSDTVNISGISITGTNAGDFAEQNNCGNSVPRGGNCKIKVTFTPTAQGKRTGDISISDDGGGSPQVVPLSGTGTP